MSALTTATEPVTSVRRLVRCSIGSDTYCIDADWLDSIQVIENLYPSRSADGSIGWIRRFDEKVPVFRLADQIDGVSRGPSRRGVIMVLKRGDRLWALLVDKVSGNAEVPSDRIFALPRIAGESAHNLFPSVVVDENGVTLYLSPDRVVPKEISGAQGQSHSAPLPTPAPTPIRRPQPATTTPTHRPSAAGQIITFTVEHGIPVDPPIRFALSAGQALEIISEPPLIPVPNSPHFMLGIASWRNQPLPVVNLAAWLGMPHATYRPGSRFLICRGTIGRSQRDIGLLGVPAVDDIRKLDLPIDYQQWTEAVRWNHALALGIYRFERSQLVIPDLDAILSFQSTPAKYKM